MNTGLYGVILKLIDWPFYVKYFSIGIYTYSAGGRSLKPPGNTKLGAFILGLYINIFIEKPVC